MPTAPKQSPTEHCEAELKLTAGVVVFSVGVNEGFPQASIDSSISMCGKGDSDTSPLVALR
jgi:hypothetical protein